MAYKLFRVKKNGTLDNNLPFVINVDNLHFCVTEPKGSYLAGTSDLKKSRTYCESWYNIRGGVPVNFFLNGLESTIM